MNNGISNLDELKRALLKHTCVRSLHLDIDFKTCKYDLLLTLSVNEVGDNELTICFYDVHALKLNDFGGGLTQFIHLTIHEIENGYDRIRYSIEELEHSSILFQCNNFEVLNKAAGFSQKGYIQLLPDCQDDIRQTLFHILETSKSENPVKKDPFTDL